MNVRSRNNQRKWRYSRSKGAAWKDAVLAVVIALSAHAVFFGVFKYKEPESAVVRQKSMVTLFNLNTLSEKEREQSLKWLELHDPKLAVRGDSSIGFSSFLPGTRQRMLTVNEFNDGHELPEKFKISYKPAVSGKAAMPGIPATEFSGAGYASGAAVLDSRGKRVELDMSKIPVSVSGTSRFVIRGKGMYRRVDTIRSCAVEQDALAANILLDSDFKENEHITVVWLKGEK